MSNKRNRENDPDHQGGARALEAQDEVDDLIHGNVLAVEVTSIAEVIETVREVTEIVNADREVP